MTLKEYITRLHRQSTFWLTRKKQRIGVRLAKTNCHITFLMRCHKLELVQIGLRLKTRFQSTKAQQFVDIAEWRLVKARLDGLHRTQQKLTRQQQEILNSRLSTTDFIMILMLTDDYSSKTHARTKKTHLTKFTRLRTEYAAGKSPAPTRRTSSTSANANYLTMNEQSSLKGSTLLFHQRKHPPWTSLQVWRKD